MQTVAQSWLVYRLTGSAGLLGLVGFAGQIPVFLLAPFGGAVADARGRHPILLATQIPSMLLALALAAVTLAGRVQVWHVFAIAALVGIVNAFDIPARQAFIADMVGRGDLMNAIALNSSMFTGARMVGPAVAGVLVGTIGEGWCFLLNGVSYVAVIGGLLLMRIEARPLRRRAGVCARQYRRRIPVRQAHAARSCAAAAARSRQPHRHALRRADAGFCRPHPARRPGDARPADGSLRCRCACGCRPSRHA